MKKCFGVLTILLVAAAIILISGCPLPPEVKAMLTPEQIDQLETDGLLIHRGSNPPNVEGSFLADSQYCVFSSDGWVNWFTFPYYYQFSEQRRDEISVAYYADSTTYSDGDLAYISGSGDNFSIFVESHGVELGIEITNVTVYSGTISPGGIIDFQFGFVMTEKGPDPGQLLINVDDHRVFLEQDTLASREAYPVATGVKSVKSLGTKGFSSR